MHKLLILLLLIPSWLYAIPPFKLPEANDLYNIRGGIITTDKGKIYFKLYPRKAPWHVANLKYLADQNFYDGLPIHIFKSGYLLQTGAPTRDPSSGPSYTIPAEFNANKHERGTLSMVRKPDHLDISHTRNSHGSQFRITLTEAPHMDGQFTVFGQVVDGFNVLDSLKLGDRILDLTVYVKQNPHQF